MNSLPKPSQGRLQNACVGRLTAPILLLLNPEPSHSRNYEKDSASGHRTAPHESFCLVHLEQCARGISGAMWVRNVGSEHLHLLPAQPSPQRRAGTNKTASRALPEPSQNSRQPFHLLPSMSWPLPSAPLALPAAILLACLSGAP